MNSRYQKEREVRIAYQKKYVERQLQTRNVRQMNILRRFRMSHSYTLREFGRFLGLSAASIQNWECGKRPINIERIRAVFPQLAADLESAARKEPQSHEETQKPICWPFHDPDCPRS